MPRLSAEKPKDTVRRTQGGTIYNALRLCSGHFQRKVILNFGISERLRAFRYPIFTAEVVTAKQYLPCRFLRKRGTAGRSSFFQRDKKQMPIAFTTLPVKRRFGKIRRFSRIANYNKIPLIMPRATRRAFQIVLLHTYKKNRTRGHGYGSQCAGIRRSLPRSSCRPPASA